MNHGTVDQGGAICGTQKKLEGIAKVQTQLTSPDLVDRYRSGGTVGQTQYLEYHAVFPEQNDTPTRRVLMGF